MGCINSKYYLLLMQPNFNLVPNQSMNQLLAHDKQLHFNMPYSHVIIEVRRKVDTIGEMYLSHRLEFTVE
jgi:hypothetical protein